MATRRPGTASDRQDAAFHGSPEKAIVMKCQEFDEIWNRLLDSETLADYKRFAGLEISPRKLGELEGAAMEHARECPRCCQAQASYQRLREALRIWAVSECKTLAPSRQLVDCNMATPALGLRRPLGRRKARLAASAAIVAAATLIAVLLTHAQIRFPNPAREGDQTGLGASLEHAAECQLASRPADARLLSEAISDATDATWDLAQATSRPAAWISRDLLEAAAGGHDSSAMTASSFLAGSPGRESALFPSVFQTVPGSPRTSDLLRQVATEVSSSIRPVSSSARQALEFLRLPSLGKPDSASLAPASKGA
jgi:hypothetical protein